jgi:hypothetical protein
MTATGLGVAGIITPWNFPIAIPAWKIAPALFTEADNRMRICRGGDFSTPSSPSSV